VRSCGTERSEAATGVGVVSWIGRVLAVATRRAWVCQCMVPTRRGARELEARRSHAVSARKEEAEALREALSPGAWHRHRGGAAALTVVDRRSRAIRCLSGNAACHGSQAKGCDGSSQRLGWSTLTWGVARISPTGSAARSRRRRAAVLGCYSARQPT
jgi:hypothetical protein